MHHIHASTALLSLRLSEFLMHSVVLWRKCTHTNHCFDPSVNDAEPVFAHALICRGTHRLSLSCSLDELVRDATKSGVKGTRLADPYRTARDRDKKPKRDSYALAAGWEAATNAAVSRSPPTEGSSTVTRERSRSERRSSSSIASTDHSPQPPWSPSAARGAPARARSDTQSLLADTYANAEAVRRHSMAMPTAEQSFETDSPAHAQAHRELPPTPNTTWTASSSSEHNDHLDAEYVNSAEARRLSTAGASVSTQRYSSHIPALCNLMCICTRPCAH